MAHVYGQITRIFVIYSCCDIVGTFNKGTRASLLSIGAGSVNSLRSGTEVRDHNFLQQQMKSEFCFPASFFPNYTSWASPWSVVHLFHPQEFLLLSSIVYCHGIFASQRILLATAGLLPILVIMATLSLMVEYSFLASTIPAAPPLSTPAYTRESPLSFSKMPIAFLLAYVVLVKWMSLGPSLRAQIVEFLFSPNKSILMFSIPYCLTIFLMVC